MSRQARFVTLAVALIAIAGVLIAADPGVGDTALRAPLEEIPLVLGAWSAGPLADTDAFRQDPGAREHLARTYRDGQRTVRLAVDYYPQQTERHRPAARELLFPGQGWSELTEQRVHLAGTRADRSLEANLVVMRAPVARMAVLYWYQIGARSIAGDHWYRAALVYHRLVERRADGALVRVGVPLAGTEDAAVAVARHADFVRALYPPLVRVLPR